MQSIIDLYRKLFKITLKMLQKENFDIFPKTSFSSDGSYVLFKFVKYNNIERVKQLLDHNKKLIWEFNYV